VSLSNVVSGVGSLTKVGTGLARLSGVNTYTGNTVINAGTLNLLNGGETRFVIQNGNVSNQILGTATVDLSGLFRLDTSALTAAAGTWNLVNVGTSNETFGGTFGLAFVGGPTFTNDGGGLYSSGPWTFSTANGNLVMVPEPSSVLSLLAGSAMLLRRRRA